MKDNIQRRMEDEAPVRNPDAANATATYPGTPSAKPAPGDKISSFGDYEVLALIGEGGMGKVYKARQPLLNRIVALKILSPKLTDDAVFISRFRREAALAANLNHANIVTVHAAGESNGIHYFIMEWVDGESLRTRLDREGRLPPAVALDICLQVALALNHAWSKAQIIHRDIKPDNIFLSRDGKIKVGDLGLAKSIGTDTPTMTEPGCFMGTPHYMSPEQAKGQKDVDFRADIYSLGCTLYHMLTGHQPYSGNSGGEIILKHINEPPPDIRKRMPGCPRPIVNLLAKMLAKDPAKRHQTYADLISDLQHTAQSLQTATSAPATPQSPIRHPKTLFALTATAAAAVALFLWSPWRPPQNVGGASAPRPTSTQSALAQLPAADILKIAYTAKAPDAPADAPKPRLRLELLAKRKGATTFTPIKDGDALVSESDDYLARVEALAPGHLYVFQVDTTGNKTWLYPRNETSPFSSGANPLATGQKVQVPSAEQGRALFLDRNTGVEHIYTVFAAARWPELETALAHPSSPAPRLAGSPSRSPTLNPQPSAINHPFGFSTRGIGGLRPTEPDQPLTADGPLLVIERWFKHVAPE